MNFFQKTAGARDVENDGSRFWAADPNGVEPFGSATVGIVDENQGGVIAYVHEDNARGVISALRAITGEE